MQRCPPQLLDLQLKVRDSNWCQLVLWRDSFSLRNTLYIQLLLRSEAIQAEIQVSLWKNGTRGQWECKNEEEHRMKCVCACVCVCLCVCVCVCEHKPIPASSHVPLNASIPRSHSIQQLGCGLGYQPVHYGKTSLDSAESSTLAPSFASQKWSVGRFSLSSLKSGLHLLLFFHLSLFLLYVTQLLWEAFFVTDMMLTVITEGNWRGRGKAEGSKSVHSQQPERCMYTYSIYVHRLHSYCSDNSSAVQHIVYVTLRVCAHIEQLWATLCTGITASTSPFLLLSPFSNTLICWFPSFLEEWGYPYWKRGR